MARVTGAHKAVFFNGLKITEPREKLREGVKNILSAVLLGHAGLGFLNCCHSH